MLQPWELVLPALYSKASQEHLVFSVLLSSAYVIGIISIVVYFFLPEIEVLRPLNRSKIRFWSDIPLF